jgi:hypothetical protein
MAVASRRRGSQFASDSPLEGDGFELPVPRAMQARLEAKIAGFGCMSPSIICGCCRWPSAKAQSEISEPNPYRARNRKFESISLQRRVRCKLDLGKAGSPMRLPPHLLKSWRPFGRAERPASGPQRRPQFGRGSLCRICFEPFRGGLPAVQDRLDQLRGSERRGR